MSEHTIETEYGRQDTETLIELVNAIQTELGTTNYLLACKTMRGGGVNLGVRFPFGLTHEEYDSLTIYQDHYDGDHTRKEGWISPGRFERLLDD